MTKYNLYDKFNFGKHKSLTIKNVIETDLSYITWCLSTIENFGLGNQAKGLYNKEIRAKQERDYEYEWPEDMGWGDWGDWGP